MPNATSRSQQRFSQHVSKDDERMLQNQSDQAQQEQQEQKQKQEPLFQSRQQHEDHELPSSEHGQQDETVTTKSIVETPMMTIETSANNDFEDYDSEEARDELSPLNSFEHSLGANSQLTFT